MTRLPLVLALLLLALAGCATRPAAPVPAEPVQVQILALNDFHGNIERPAAPVRMQVGDDQFVTAQAGGAAVVTAELAKLRGGQRNSITVAAGDLIGASPLTSAWFLDEPTIAALNLMGLSVASVGNHEFDKGSDELLRIQNGGCEKFTARVPCRVEPFAGADFQYLAGNVRKDDGTTVLPATAIRDVGPIRIGFIGLTLEGTADLVTPAGVAGLGFTGEAEAANALVPRLKAEGADTIVLLLHEGGKTAETYKLQGCDGLSGPILPILDRLDPAIVTIVSGHTHNAYACEIDRGGAKRLLTSAGKNGYLVSDIRLSFDPTTQQLVAQAARNVPMIGDGSEDARVAALVKRYSDAVEPVASRIIGRLASAAPFSETNGESAAANLIADATLAATHAPANGGAQLALVNATGVRVGLPAGEVRFKDAFAMMPFGNNLLVVTLTGAQLKAALEQQFSSAAAKPAVLAPSAGFTYAADLSKPEGSRISDMRLDGRPIDQAGTYRVALNNYLASGGDNITAFKAGTDISDRGIIDLDAMVDWIRKISEPPVPNRIRISGAEARRSS